MNKQPTFRCPACDKLSEDETAGHGASVLLCEHCGHTIATHDLLEGEDGICGLRPDPGTDGWQRSFQAVYPDGAQRVFDLDGQPVQEGDALPGTRFVVKRWKVSEEPLSGGRFEVIGFLGVPGDD
jgi:hypothetical protein